MVDLEDKIKEIKNERSNSDQISHNLITEKYEAISQILSREKHERAEQEKQADEAIKSFFQRIIQRIDEESRAQEQGETKLLEVTEVACHNLNCLSQI